MSHTMTIAEWRAHAASIRRAWYRTQDDLARSRKMVKRLRRQVWRLSAQLPPKDATP
jgi:hypothetical protein